MRLLLMALALLFCGAVLFLVFASSSDPLPPCPVAPGRGSREAEPADHAQPVEAAQPQPPSSPDRMLEPEAAQDDVDALLDRADKEAWTTLLGDWRSGRLSRDEDRRIAEALAGQSPASIDKLAGYVFLEHELEPAQADGLASLLATSGTELAVGYLLEGAARPQLRAPAVQALATVSELGSLPALAAAIQPTAAPDVLQAMRAALRNMDTAKARDLEQEIAAILDP